MKILLSIILSVCAFAFPLATDIQDPKTNADEVLFLATDNFECNLYIEKAGQALLMMSKAEETHNKSALHNQYIIFLDQSDKAIAICKDISTGVAHDLVDIRTDVEIYYKLIYK